MTAAREGSTTTTEQNDIMNRQTGTEIRRSGKRRWRRAKRTIGRENCDLPPSKSSRPRTRCLRWSILVQKSCRHSAQTEGWVRTALASHGGLFQRAPGFAQSRSTASWRGSARSRSHARQCSRSSRTHTSGEACVTRGEGPRAVGWDVRKEIWMRSRRERVSHGATTSQGVVL